VGRNCSYKVNTEKVVTKLLLYTFTVKGDNGKFISSHQDSSHLRYIKYSVSIFTSSVDNQNNVIFFRKQLITLVVSNTHSSGDGPL